MRIQMTRAGLVLTLFWALAACQAPGLSQQSRPETVATVALQPGDVAGLHRCGESGPLDSVLQAERTGNPMAYDLNATEWAQWRRQGALDAYYVVYGRTTTDCASLTEAGTGAPEGGLMAGLVVRFQNESIASRNFKLGSTLFGFGPRDLAFVRLSGGSVTVGSPTGLGVDSAIGRASVPGATYYFAFWQKKIFSSYLVAYDVASADADTATTSVNQRIQ